MRAHQTRETQSFVGGRDLLSKRLTDVGFLGPRICSECSHRRKNLQVVKSREKKDSNRLRGLSHCSFVICWKQCACIPIFPLTHQAGQAPNCGSVDTLRLGDLPPGRKVTMVEFRNNPDSRQWPVRVARLRALS